MGVQQGPLGTPVAFLQRLQDALQKHTNNVLESQEEDIILKDKFLTQSAPDIHRNLQKLVVEMTRDLDQLVHIATYVYYNRDLEKKEGPGKGKQKCTDISTVRGSLGEQSKPTDKFLVFFSITLNFFLFFIYLFIFINLFICAYIVWSISPPCPQPPSFLPHPLASRQKLFCPFLQFC
jgi:hypothetical protein